MKKLILIFTLLLLCYFTYSQTDVDDRMYQKKVVRAIDLRTLQNEPWFSVNNELTGFLLDAVKEHKIRAYKNDSLNEVLEIEKVKEHLLIPGTETVETGFEDWCCDGWPDESPEASGPYYYSARDLYQIEITENIYFDKEHSVMKYEILSLSVFVPADHPENIRGIQSLVFTIDYQELVNLAKDDPEAQWVNPKNDVANLSYADAFDLRLFDSYIIKVSNPKNEYLVDVYGQEDGIIASQKQAYNFLEFESNLWEY